ncbi:CTP synthase [Luteolibacter sp. GHJ8]|jgi:CTP synthase|uniref:CTP synthase n=1 Tax=Luteolibacter rhizosphaerae TaxID=2989719 RepID=A0ABT3G1U6_9BACT|nr:CTP synthase [Luteolibacter rhizosphaerae]MCW1913806.1 CTP synthase [Luteolibacter rhizosphaerae]
MKYIFVTGGVVSSLGKGLAAASIGALLEHRGLKTLMQKFDPYLNVDPGTMSPYQHGEVYVLDDGAETDLDLGHYERFTSGVLSRMNNMTSGQVFDAVIKKERRGEYLGKTVQFIPHVTDEIKSRIHKVSETNPDVNVLITEIGGTVGDMEGLLFIEALRQFALEVGKENVCFIHVTLLPYIKAAGEVKTKPTQQSVAKLRELGIQPDIIICRTEADLDEDNRKKIAMFCNVEKKNVVAFRDVAHTIYECPLDLRRDKIDRLVVDRIGLGHTPAPALEDWEHFVRRVIHPKNKVTIAVAGKYIELQDAYKSIYESLIHAGAHHDTKVNIVRVEAEAIEDHGAKAVIGDVDGILVPGGFGDRGIEGKILAAQYARENDIPYFGICLGMQIATIEFARNVCKLKNANSTEFDKSTPFPVICLQEEQKGVEDMGATMRLGSCESIVFAGTKASDLYGGADRIHERHRHRYEFNSDFQDKLQECGLVISSVSADEGLVEIVELPQHPFFVGAQFHPEFQSKPNKPHPLFAGFVKASLERAQAQ